MDGTAWRNRIAADCEMRKARAEEKAKASKVHTGCGGDVAQIASEREVVYVCHKCALLWSDQDPTGVVIPVAMRGPAFTQARHKRTAERKAA